MRPLRKYRPGNMSTFPKDTLRVGEFFNPRVAALLIMLIRLGVTRYY